LLYIADYFAFTTETTQRTSLERYWVKAVQLQRKLRCKRTQKVEALDSNKHEKEVQKFANTMNDKVEVTVGWKHVASSIDSLAFWSFMITNLLITVVVFCILATS
jgi:hypothetical protein